MDDAARRPHEPKPRRVLAAPSMSKMFGEMRTTGSGRLACTRHAGTDQRPQGLRRSAWRHTVRRSMPTPSRMLWLEFWSTTSPADPRWIRKRAKQHGIRR
jgi:hypothetical protein